MTESETQPLLHSEHGKKKVKQVGSSQAAAVLQALQGDSVFLEWHSLLPLALPKVLLSFLSFKNTFIK